MCKTDCVFVPKCPQEDTKMKKSSRVDRRIMGGLHLIKGHLRVRISGLILVNANPACDYDTSPLAPIVSLVGHKVNTVHCNYR